jgi:hypothetical protein
MAKKKPAKRQAALKPQHKIFALIYLANGGNATAAYNEAMGGAGKRTEASTHQCASRLLSSVKVQAFISAQGAKVLRAVEATAEEAMAAITRTLRLDPRLLLDEAGKPLAMHLWPDDVALVVKGVKANGDVIFYDKMKAAELIAEAHGRIKKKLDVSLTFDHVKYLADKSRPKE